MINWFLPKNDFQNFFIHFIFNSVDFILISGGGEKLHFNNKKPLVGAGSGGTLLMAD